MLFSNKGIYYREAQNKLICQKNLNSKPKGSTRHSIKAILFNVDLSHAYNKVQISTYISRRFFSEIGNQEV